MEDNPIYKLKIEWNDYIMEQIYYSPTLKFDNIEFYKYKICDKFPPLSLLYKKNITPNIRIYLLKNINQPNKEEYDIIFDSHDIKLPKKLYKLYSHSYKKLYTHSEEFDNYIVCIDIMQYYDIKFLKSVYLIIK